MRKDQEAYRQMYALIRPVVRHKQVLELAAGTGLIAKNIVHSADHIEATDASEEMIRQAKQGAQSAKLHFSVQDMFCLPYVPEPEKALAEIHRVLKNDGVLIAPTFTHANNHVRGRVKAFLMKLAGFHQYNKWSADGYLDFLQEYGWKVQKSVVLKASFPLTYAECVKSEATSGGREESL